MNEGRRTELYNMGKEGRGSLTDRPISKGRPIHSCRNSWTSFSKIMISRRHLYERIPSPSSVSSSRACYVVCAAMARHRPLN